MNAIGEHLLFTAGGNGSAVRILNRPLTRAQYRARGKALGRQLEERGAEQAGFLVMKGTELPHLEMAGGEFCGNTCRSAAYLISRMTDRDQMRFTASGFDGTIEATVQHIDDTKADVACLFPHMQYKVKDLKLQTGEFATMVDFGGIVHIVVHAPFPGERLGYEKMHRRVVRELGLQERAAVGVVWTRCPQNMVNIFPVVGVREANTFFFENSCGSGSIAVGLVDGCGHLVQPTGKVIELLRKENDITLRSSVEIKA